jgi:RimJ/RimL family protein N-acetyltransferase
LPRLEIEQIIEMHDILADSGVAALFDDDLPDRPVLQAALAGRAPARAVADSPKNPGWCVVKLAAWNCAFIGGEPGRAEMIAALERLRQGRLIGLVAWPGNAAYLASLALPTIAVPRLEFSGPDVRSDRFQQWLSAVPSPCRVAPLDDAWFERSLWREDYLASHGSAAVFLASAMGFCLVRDGEIISEATATFVAGGQAEIGAITAEACGGRGYAPIMAAHLIRACEHQGLETLWSCDREHQASVAVARKLGYVRVREYEHLYCDPRVPLGQDRLPPPT